ncbi:MAG: AAA family ATPase [Bacilli bacterium]
MLLYFDNYGYGNRDITPEVILDCIAKDKDSSILNYFIRTYTDYSYIYRHPSFKNIQTNLSISTIPSPSSLNITLDNINKSIKDIEFSLKKSDIKKLSIEDEKNETEENKNSLTEEKLWELLSDIQKRFIGQEVAAEFLFYNIVNNQELANRDDVMDGERSIIFLDGPTGTGKTGIARAITDELDIPFTRTSITNYSSTGYVGGNITDTLKELLDKADGDLEKAQRGIIVFDEFDKIAYSRGNGSLEMKKAVQQQLLDFMGGGKYNVSTGGGFFGSSSVEFDTSKLTFICLAALTDLREDKTATTSIIGFGEQNNNESQEKEYTITPQDLIDIGIERELVGRFNTYLHTNPYSKESLLKILKESTISPMIGFEKWISSKGKKLEIADDTYDAIVDAAYDLNTGARSLQTIVNNIRTPFIKEVMRGDSEVISLDADVVKNTTASMFERKDRK